MSHFHQHHVFCFPSSYLGSSGGNYGVINNSRIKRRPSSHFEMEINECELLCDQIKKQMSDSITACETRLYILRMQGVFLPFFSVSVDKSSKN